MQAFHGYIIGAWRTYNPGEPDSMPKDTWADKEISKVYDTMKYIRSAYKKSNKIMGRATTGGHPTKEEGTLSWAFIKAKATGDEIVIS